MHGKPSAPSAFAEKMTRDQHNYGYKTSKVQHAISCIVKP
jgi:hypothetical protein